MTKDEAKSKYITTPTDMYDELTNIRVAFVIDNIYDDLEQRTCESCKWFVPHKADIPNEFEGTCDAGVYMDGDNLGDMVSVDFMCNQWEKK